MANISFSLSGGRKRILDIYFEKYIVKAGTAEGGAGTGTAIGMVERISNWLRWGAWQAGRGGRVRRGGAGGVRGARVCVGG